MLPTAARVVFCDALLVLSSLAVCWVVAGALIGWERWVKLPAGWSWSPYADWEAQAVLGAIGAALPLLTAVITAARCCGGGTGARAEPTSELDRASLLSRITFWWVVPTLDRCRMAGKLELADMPAPAARDEPEALYARFAAACSGRPLGPWRLLGAAAWSIQRPVFLQCCVAGWLFLGAMLLDPILLRLLLSSGEASGAPAGQVSGWLGGEAERRTPRTRPR